MHGGNNTGSGSVKKHELFWVTQPIHNHTREPHTTHTTPDIGMDNEIESIDNQSEEVAVASAAAAASIMMGLIEQEAEDEDCAGAPCERGRRRSPRQSREGGPTRGLSTWNRRGDSGYGSSKSCILRKVGLDEDCREARQFVVAFRVPYQMFLGIVEAVAPAFPAAAHDVAGRECIPVELKVRLALLALSVRCMMACACRPVR